MDVPSRVNAAAASMRAASVRREDARAPAVLRFDGGSLAAGFSAVVMLVSRILRGSVPAVPAQQGKS
jgi:hypothetical protein